MEKYLSFKCVSKEEHQKILEEEQQEGVPVSELPKHEQERIKNMFKATFTDDRNEYQKYRCKQEEEKIKALKPIIHEYSG